MGVFQKIIFRFSFFKNIPLMTVNDRFCLKINQPLYPRTKVLRILLWIVHITLFII